MFHSHTEPKNINHASNISSKSISFILSLLTTLVFISLILYCVTNKLNLSAFYEEFTGYGYFYSLRSVYGVLEHPWQPHHQLLSIFYQLIQSLLSLIGFPPDNLFQRINVFNAIVSIFPFFFFCLIFFKLLQLIKSLSIKMYMCTAILCFYYFPYQHNTLEYILAPEYYPWALPISILSFYFYFSFHRAILEPKVLLFVLIGIFTGLSIAIKFTYIIFWLPTLIISFDSIKFSNKKYLTILLLAVAPLFVWFTILYIYFGLNYTLVLNYFADTIYFLSSTTKDISKASDVNFFIWVFAWGFKSSIYYDIFFTFLMFSLLACCFFHKNRLKFVSLSCCLVLELYFYYIRPTPGTYIELLSFSLFITLFLIILIAPKLNALNFFSINFKRIKGNTLFVINSIFLSFLIFLLFPHSKVNFTNLLSSIHMAHATDQKIFDFINRKPGRVMILIPQNKYRFTSTLSAICKGGMDIFSNCWGDSPLMESIFNNLFFITVSYKWTSVTRCLAEKNIAYFDKILFTRSTNETIFSALKRLKKYYSLPDNYFTSFNCRDLIVQGDTVAVACHLIKPKRKATYISDAYFIKTIVPIKHLKRKRSRNIISLNKKTIFVLYLKKENEAWKKIGSIDCSNDTRYKIGDLNPRATYYLKLEYWRGQKIVDLADSIKIPPGFLSENEISAANKIVYSGNTLDIYRVNPQTVVLHLNFQSVWDDSKIYSYGKYILRDIERISYVNGINKEFTFAGQGNLFIKHVHHGLCESYTIDFQPKKYDRFLIVNRFFNNRWKVFNANKVVRTFPSNFTMIGFFVPKNTKSVKLKYFSTIIP